MKPLPTKEIAAFFQITRETFVGWGVRPHEKRGRKNYYLPADVLENRVQHREGVIRAEYDREARRNGNNATSPIDEAALEAETRAELAEFVSKQVFGRLWSHLDMFAGVLGYATDEVKISPAAAFDVLVFTAIQMVGALADGFQIDRAEFECAMPDWFGELNELGKEKFLEQRWPEIKRLNDEWRKAQH